MESQRVFISDDDIRLELAVWNDTLIKLIPGERKQDINSIIDDQVEGNITLYTETIPDGFNLDEDQVYIIEEYNPGVNLVYSRSDDFSKILGASYGSEIFVGNVRFLESILNNRGKFRRVYLFRSSTSEEIGNEPTETLNINESIVASYHGFVDYLESNPFDDTLISNNGLYTLLFPTNKEVPHESSQSMNITLTNEEVEEMIHGDELVNAVRRCTIFTNAHFLENLLNSMFLFFRKLGIFFVDNQFVIHDYNSFDEYIVQRGDKVERVQQILLRLLISLDTFGLVAQHDNLKDYLINLIDEYQMKNEVTSEWNYY